MNRQQGVLEIHAAVLLFGLAGLFGKWLPLSPFIIVLGRVFFASIALFLVLKFSKQSMKISSLKVLSLFFLLGLILAVHWVSFFKSVQVSTVAVALLSYSSFPVFTAFLEPLFLKEKMRPWSIIAALLCSFGVFLVIPRFDPNSAIARGVLWGLISGLTFSVLSILNRRLSQQFSSLVIAFYQDLTAALLLLPFFFLIPDRLSSQDVLLLLLLGVFCTAGAHTLFIQGMRYIRAQTAAILSTLEPVYGIIMAYLLLREIPSLRTLLGGAVILGTAFLVTLKATKS